ncbi:hypothetical protein [Mesorhizobium sp. L-2-11]|uniref:hypothetical protein n=1 Tax=Mesorhizobium sp. L-2-11 TaxID=2744521 RepID=UPI00192808BB|nr:hypothetical protein [Mesorhizobium sp. L-2-11]BCH14956.1 hypothetical protein MesoLjLa_18070 [Mesorhizobium sp. L-2-11]
MRKHSHVETARAALARAAWSRGDSPTYGQEAVSDLLADLKHFCVAANIDFATCDRLAEMYFDAESEDEQ